MKAKFKMASHNNPSNAVENPMQGRVLGGYLLLSPMGGRSLPTGVDFVLGRRAARSYRAIHVDTAKSAVVKLVGVQVDLSAEERAKFLYFVDKFAALSNENIVPICAHGFEGDNFFFVTEYLDGESLHVRLSSIGEQCKRLSFPEILKLCKDISAGLDYLHDHGLVHGDLRPFNIFIDGTGRARLTNFAIAPHAGGLVIDPLSVSVSFMAPELVLDQRVVSPRTDQYSLGVLLFRMITGELPFQGDTVLGIAAQHVIAAPRSLRQADKAISVEIEDVVLRALHRNANLRYPSCRVLCNELEKAFNCSRDPTVGAPIFISYKREDWQVYVEPLVTRLRECGLSVWVDQHTLRAGEDWLDHINQALNICDKMILCVTSAALASRHVKTEYRFFYNKGKTIFPFICEDTELPAELEVIQSYPFRDMDKLLKVLLHH